ncbi:MAG TPA: carbon starvation CstA family protein, partial [Gemmatales bacterium]|nr:carbon starvation CstA family protein [Gemmatales bacterium]
ALVHFTPGCTIQYPGASRPILRAEGFTLRTYAEELMIVKPRKGQRTNEYVVRPLAVQLIPGSSWGMFTIACTIPIALLVSFYMYRLRRGRVLEASILGAVGVLAATVAGAWIPGSSLEKYFSLSQGQTTFALCAYGFIASVLPVWMLLCPRDYISSFLKIGTIILLVVGVVVANPVLRHPPLNETFQAGGPTFEGGVFPFVFICVMCGAISGFHALVSSGTTPKMIDKESHIRPIGYGAMLIEGLVGVMALIAAAALPVDLYYDINTPLEKAPQLEPKLAELYQSLGVPAAKDRLHAVGVKDVAHLDLNDLETMVGGEALRGRTGGAVTLAVSMALIFTQALAWTAWPVAKVMAYWYHFAIMFEALFILTTIDTGTRIARFLLQEMLGRVHPKFQQTDWLPGALLATLLVTLGWGTLVATGSISTIWPMFGIANQLLAVVALALITSLLINGGKARYVWVTLPPMLFVTLTTLTAGAQLVGQQFPARIRLGQQLGNFSMQLTGWLSLVLALVIMVIVSLILLLAASRWFVVLTGRAGPPRPGSTA